MTQHITKCIDTILQKHQSTGIILTGDLNHLKHSSITSAFNLKQIVTQPTRGSKILDKVLTNMSSLYQCPEILPQIGKSDHFPVLCKPSPIYEKLRITPIKTMKRCSGKNEKALFANALMSVKWDILYRLDSCKTAIRSVQQNHTKSTEHIFTMERKHLLSL